MEFSNKWNLATNGILRIIKTFLYGDGKLTALSVDWK